MNRPPSIVLFERLYLVVIVIGVLGTALSWTSVKAMAVNQPGLSEGAATGLLIGSLAFGFLIPVLLVYLIARRANNVAKWIFVALAALGLYFSIAGLADPVVSGGLLMIVNLVSTVLSLYCAWLLFKPDARAWLESKGEHGPADPTVFD